MHQTEAKPDEEGPNEKDRKTNEVDEGWTIVRNRKKGLKQRKNTSTSDRPETTEEPKEDDNRTTTINENQ